MHLQLDSSVWITPADVFPPHHSSKWSHLRLIGRSIQNGCRIINLRGMWGIGMNEVGQANYSLVDWWCRVFSFSRETWNNAHQNSDFPYILKGKGACWWLSERCAKWMHWGISRHVTFGASAWVKLAKQTSRLVGWCCRVFFLVSQAYDDAHQNFVSCYIFEERVAHLTVQMATFVKRVHKMNALRDRSADEVTIGASAWVKRTK